MTIRRFTHLVCLLTALILLGTACPGGKPKPRSIPTSTVSDAQRPFSERCNDGARVASGYVGNLFVKLAFVRPSTTSVRVCVRAQEAPAPSLTLPTASPGGGEYVGGMIEATVNGPVSAQVLPDETACPNNGDLDKTTGKIGVLQNDYQASVKVNVDEATGKLAACVIVRPATNLSPPPKPYVVGVTAGAVENAARAAFKTDGNDGTIKASPDPEVPNEARNPSSRCQQNTEGGDRTRLINLGVLDKLHVWLDALIVKVPPTNIVCVRGEGNLLAGAPVSGGSWVSLSTGNLLVGTTCADPKNRLLSYEDLTTYVMTNPSKPGACASLGSLSQALSISTTVAVPGDPKFQNDPPAVLTQVQFEQPEYGFEENAGRQRIFVVRSGTAASIVKVEIALAAVSAQEGTAEKGSDYNAANATITFLPGQTKREFNVEIVNDALCEGDRRTVPPRSENEYFSVRVSNSIGAGIGEPSSSTVTILENDSCVHFLQGPTTAAEATGTVTLPVERTGNQRGTVTVGLKNADGTAKAPSDYAPVSTQVTFSDSKSEPDAQPQVTLVGDEKGEESEKFSMRLEGPSSGARIDSPASVEVTILDDDGGPQYLPDLIVGAGGLERGRNISDAGVTTCTTASTTAFCDAHQKLDVLARRPAQVPPAFGITVRNASAKTDDTYTVRGTRSCPAGFVVNIYEAGIAKTAEVFGAGYKLPESVAGQSRGLQLRLSVPPYARVRSRCVVVVTVTSQGDPAKGDVVKAVWTIQGALPDALIRVPAGKFLGDGIYYDRTHYASTADYARALARQTLANRVRRGSRAFLWGYIAVQNDGTLIGAGGRRLDNIRVTLPANPSGFVVRYFWVTGTSKTEIKNGHVFRDVEVGKPRIIRVEVTVARTIAAGTVRDFRVLLGSAIEPRYVDAVVARVAVT